TCLTCHSAKPLDVAPLARAPRLAYAAFLFEYRWAHIAGEPRDYSPLAESPSLRELHVPACPPVATEVAALNAAFPPWDDCLLLPEPHPLPPLRITSAPLGKQPPPREFHYLPGEREPMDDGLRQCEARWVARQIGRAVSRRLGCEDWGNAGFETYQAGARTVNPRPAPAPARPVGSRGGIR
ncbi:MAG: hypothetical protein HY301_17295, partial [Verrucomicrobia bacterium]|nr:hypothetical protein [Verrucomicrobiota bacterium]